LVVYGGTGCPDTSYATREIVVEPAPVANLTPAGPFQGCGVVPTIQLTATAQSGYAPIDIFEWFDANGTVQGPCPACPTYTPSAFGGYYVEVTGPNGCKDETNTVQIQEDCDTSTCAVPETLSIAGGLIDCGTLSYQGSFTGSGFDPSWNVPPGASATFSNGNNDVEATFTEAGSYRFTYRVRYVVGGDTCVLNESVIDTVPYIADLKYTVACVSGGYQLTLLDQSNFFPPTPISSYAFYQDGVLLGSGSATSISTATLPAGSYDFELIIQGGSFPACTASVTVDLPALPQADFTFATDGTCENTPVFFTNASTGAVSYLWDFDDQSSNTQPDPERVFNPDDFYDVTLTASNAVGCSDTETQTVSISANELGGIIGAAPNGECEGLPITLTYNSFTSTFPTTYYWMEGTDTVATTAPGSSYDVFTAGGYWAIGTDANGCIIRTIPTIPVSFIEVPTPVITGEAQQCAHEPFTLQGYAGPGVDSYQWLRNDTLLSGATQPSLEVSGLGVGSYDFQVVVEVDGCTDTSAVFTVTVSALPTVSLTVPSLICDPYLVDLEASGIPAGGSYAWSHGVSGSSVTVNQGGPYQVFYTAPNGCTAEAELFVPKDPSAYLWIFPAGCYTYCFQEFPFLLPAPLPGFRAWEWWHSGSNSEDGNTSFVDDYEVSEPGQYVLSLENYLGCERSSDTMSVTGQDCGPCSEEEFKLDVEEWDYLNCVYTFTATLVGPGSSFTVSASQGSITPSSGSLNVSQPFVLTLPSPFGGGTVVLTFLVTLPDGSKCVYEWNIPLGECFSGEPGKRALDPTEEAGQPEAGSYLRLQPNPSPGQLTVAYALAQKAEGVSASLTLYDQQGRALRQTELRQAQGQWQADLRALPEGLYLVVLRRGSEVIAQQKLSLRR